MTDEDEFKFLQNLVLAASGLTFAALVLVIMQAVYIEKVTKRYKQLRQTTDELLQLEHRDRRHRLELTMIEASRQHLDDRIRDIQGRINNLTIQYPPSSTFTDLPSPPTPSELREMHVLTPGRRESSTRPEAMDSGLPRVDLGGKLMIRAPGPERAGIEGDGDQTVRVALTAHDAEGPPRIPPPPPRGKAGREGEGKKEAVWDRGCSELTEENK